MNNTVTVELPRAERSEDSTGGKIGFTMSWVARKLTGEDYIDQQQVIEEY